MRPSRATTLVVLLAGLSASADERRAPPVGWSVAAGLATAIVPLAVGGGVLAFAEPGDRALRHGGIDAMLVGLMLAPAVSHLVAREWKRAVLFSIVPALSAAAAIGIFEYREDVLDRGAPALQIALGAALAIELIASGIGLADSLGAAERARRRAPAIQAAPGGVAFTFGGP